MLALKIIAGVLVAVGFAIVLGSKGLVKRFNLDQKVDVEFEHEMNEEEIVQYKITKASVSVKMVGMLIALPGIIITLVAFK